MEAEYRIQWGEFGQWLLIVEPNEVVRTGLCSMAEAIPIVADVTACADPATALRHVRTGSISTILLSDACGAAQTQVLREEAGRRDIKYLITMRERGPIPEDALEMVSHGVIVIESLTTQMLTNILHRVLLDQVVMPTRIFQRVIRQYRADGSAPGHPVLTPRERQVLEGLSAGLSNKQIARQLSISEHGVKRHVAKVLAKLNCPSRTHAVSSALQSGLLAGCPSRSGGGLG
jgi:two-component system, NarL family, nitrate/nitrite response regulator NarL